MRTKLRSTPTGTAASRALKAAPEPSGDGHKGPAKPAPANAAAAGSPQRGEAAPAPAPQREQRFRLLFQYARDAIIVADQETGLVVDANPRAEKLVGRPLAELRNMRHATLFPPQSQGIIAPLFSSRGSDQLVEAEVLRSDGSRVPVEVTTAPLTDPSGRIFRFATLRSIVQRKATEQALQKAQSQIIQQEKLATIGQLAAGVAHEINNPVCFVQSNLTSLGRYLDKLLYYLETVNQLAEVHFPPEAKEELTRQWRRAKLDFVVEDAPALIAQSQEGTCRIKTIVKDLTSFARNGENRFQPVDLNACIEATLPLVWNQIKRVAKLEQSREEIASVMGDAQKLSQVLLNLLVNASHAVSHPGTISIRTWQEGGTVCVSVGDNGCGIAAELQERIFEPFFTTKEAGMGTGLGLSITREIVHKHGGTIEVSSRVGAGTTFLVRLPAMED